MKASVMQRLVIGTVTTMSVALAGLGAPNSMAYASNGGHPGAGHPDVTQGPSLTSVATGTGHRVTAGVVGPLPTNVSDGHTPPPATVRDHRNGDSCLSTAQGGVVVTSTPPPPPGNGGHGHGGYGYGGYGGPTGGGSRPIAPLC
jgi:hypothetical protein